MWDSGGTLLTNKASASLAEKTATPALTVLFAISAQQVSTLREQCASSATAQEISLKMRGLARTVQNTVKLAQAQRFAQSA